jgi:diguanylate cyclase (GGDEF)-like protein
MKRRNFEELKLTGQLPSPSGVGVQILRLTQGDDFSTEEIGQAISADSALTGRLLKLANSVQSGSVRPITTIGEATIRLGIRSVRNVALGLSLISSNRHGICPAFDYERYWSMSLARAVAMQQLSRQLGVGVPAEMYVLGLLADIGSLALASVYPEAYSELLTFGEYQDIDSLEREEERRFDISHSHVAACMLADWGLPKEFGEAVKAFERLDIESSEDVFTSAAGQLHVASVIVELGMLDPSASREQWEELTGLYFQLRERCSLSPERFDNICNSIGAEWREWGQLLGIPTTRPTNFSNLEEKLEEIFDAKHALGRASGHRAAAQLHEDSPCTTGLRILAVDDDPISLKLLERYLVRAGHEVITARDGDQALELLCSKSPQLIVADWMMPKLDGVELCRQVRAMEQLRKVYFLLLTGKGEEDSILEAFEAGVDDYVTKPFNPRILLARIQAGSRIVSLQEKLEYASVKDKKQLVDLKRLTGKLRSAALTDPLTGLPNRRFAMKRLTQIWEASTRTGKPASLIMLDIDHFKAVNDELGHDAGDTVLKETAIRLRDSCRESEDVCRIGGEEFLVICANADQSEAMACAERLRLAVESNTVILDDVSRQVTLSLGVAARAPWMQDGDDLMRSADEAAYLAKERGRNRIACADIGGERRKSA